LRKHLKTVLLFLIIVCILWRLWRRLNWSEVRLSFSQANNFLVAASVAVSCGTNFLRACRWRTLLSPLAVTRLQEVFAATNIGIGAGFLFTGPVGEVVRPLALSALNKQVPATASFLTVVVERIFDLCALSMLFGLTIVWLPEISSGQAVSSQFRLLGIILLVLPTIALCSLILFRSRLASASGWVDEKLVRRHSSPGKIRQTGARYLQKLFVAFSVLSNSRELLVIILWTAGQWLSVLLTNWLILHAFGLDFGFRQALLVMCCGLIGAQIPIPGGAAGAFHAALSGALVFMGVTLGQAAAISITAHLVGFMPALAFGTYYLLRSKIKLTTLQRGISSVNDQGNEKRHLEIEYHPPGREITRD
jgi:uncharacterized protein (TIRG00374 family)